MYLLQVEYNGNRQSAILVMAYLISISMPIQTVVYASKVARFGPLASLSVLKLYMCALIFLLVFFPSSRKWVFLPNWLFVEWPQMVLWSQIRMTEACWIYVALIQELWMLFETSLRIWFNFLGICSSQWVHCWQQTSPWELPAKYTCIRIWHIIYISECYLFVKGKQEKQMRILFCLFSCCTLFKITVGSLLKVATGLHNT